MKVAGYDVREVVLADFEFRAPPGHRPQPVCLVARELVSGRTVRLFGEELTSLEQPPYPIDRNTLFVAYYASAELGCHRALGWAPPVNILDLHAEYRNQTNGTKQRVVASQLAALSHFGLDAIDATEKQRMRDLVMRGEPYTAAEAGEIVAYCESDVRALERLLPKMAPTLDLARALLRGRYMNAAAAIEWNGVPIDIDMLERLRAGWPTIKDRLIESIDQAYGVYEGQTFKVAKFERYLVDNGIRWPHHDSGALDLTDETFRDMARIHPQLAPLRELRHAISQLRLESIEVGPDGHNRVLVSTFGSRTSRNTPSNTRSIFGPAVWLRHIIKPSEGRAIAYIDYAQQEIGIAAALAHDQNLLTAYTSGDSYLSFAKLAGAVPADATRATHAPERELFKSTMLGVNYMMGAESLALRIGKPVDYAKELLRQHRIVFDRYWRWSDATLDRAILTGSLSTRFGWRVLVTKDTSPNSLRNFPMQAHGAEMLRIACILGIERGVEICAPVHDAVLIEASCTEIDAAVVVMRDAMAEASKIVLGDLKLGTEAKVVRHPDRYVDPRGVEMWRRVNALLKVDEGVQPCIAT